MLKYKLLELFRLNDFLVNSLSAVQAIPEPGNTFQKFHILDSFSLSMGKLSLDSEPAKEVILMHQVSII
jgi:hypothetical protein